MSSVIYQFYQDCTAFKLFLIINQWNNEWITLPSYRGAFAPKNIKMYSQLLVMYLKLNFIYNCPDLHNKIFFSECSLITVFNSVMYKFQPIWVLMFKIRMSGLSWQVSQEFSHILFYSGSKLYKSIFGSHYQKGVISPFILVFRIKREA